MRTVSNNTWQILSIIVFIKYEVMAVKFFWKLYGVNIFWSPFTLNSFPFIFDWNPTCLSIQIVCTYNWIYRFRRLSIWAPYKLHESMLWKQTTTDYMLLHISPHTSEHAQTSGCLWLSNIVSPLVGLANIKISVDNCIKVHIKPF